MVIFNELRISEDRQCLTVDVEVEDVDGYDGMYIDGIYLEYYENVKDNHLPSEKSYTIYSHVEDREETHVRASITFDDIDVPDFGATSFKNGLFFVYVKCDGNVINASVLEGYGCGADRTWDVGVALDWKTVYEQGIGYAAMIARACGNPCTDSVGFKQFVILWYAMQLAISTCDYCRIRDLWKKFLRTFSGFSTASSIGRCGCGK